MFNLGLPARDIQRTWGKSFFWRSNARVVIHEQLVSSFCFVKRSLSPRTSGMSFRCVRMLRSIINDYMSCFIII